LISFAARSTFHPVRIREHTERAVDKTAASAEPIINMGSRARAHEASIIDDPAVPGQTEFFIGIGGTK
jgi:hypothetical protein